MTAATVVRSGPPDAWLDRYAGIHPCPSLAPGMQSATHPLLRRLLLVRDEMQAHLCPDHTLMRHVDDAPDWPRFGLIPDAAADRQSATALAWFRR